MKLEFNVLLNLLAWSEVMSTAFSSFNSKVPPEPFVTLTGLPLRNVSVSSGLRDSKVFIPVSMSMTPT